MAESESNLSIEETNKLRAELGLAPLVEEKKKPDFVHVPATNISNDLSTAKEIEKQTNSNIRAYIDKELSKEQGYKVKEQSTEDFLDKVVNKSKLLEHRNEFKEIEERIIKDPFSYSSQHLSGLTVEHKPKNFDTNVPMILTLKDKDILEDKEEVLVNLNLLENERAKKAVRDRKLGYYQDPVDSDEDDDLVKMGLKDRTLLGKYDEKEKSSFKLSADGGYSMKEAVIEKERLQKMAQGEISLNDTEVRIAPDISQDDILSKLSNKKRSARIRKAHPPKKSFDENKTEEGELEEDKKGVSVKTEKKESKIVEEESDEEGFMFASSIVNAPPKSIVANVNVERELIHLKNLKREKVDCNINKYMDEFYEDDTEKPTPSNKTGQRKNYEIDGVNVLQQFTMNVERSMLEQAKQSRNQKEQEKPKPPPVVTKEKSPTPPSKSPEIVEDEPIVTSGWQPEEALIEQSNSKHSRKRKSSNKGLTIYKSSSSKPPKPKVIKIQEGILGDEINVDKSLYATVLYAQKKGYLDDDKKKKQESLITNPKVKEALKVQNFYEEKQRYDDPAEIKMARRERQSGPLTRFDDKLDFNPDVKLEYIDAYGQQQEPKEAFRSLSHRFHGKASGKIKTQKRKMKVEQDCNIVTTATEHAMNSKDKLYRRMKKDKSFCVTLTGKDKI